MLGFGIDGNGLTIDELFAIRPGTGLTYDDIIVFPHYIEEEPERVDLTVEIAPGLRINPIISSPMDTVTEWSMAVHMALNGCLGVLHINLTPEEAAEQVRKVKRFQMGFIRDPFCRRPDHTVADARRVKQEKGFSTIVVTEDGTIGSRFLGLITRSCLDLVEDDRRPISSVMIPLALLASQGGIRAAKDIPDLGAALAEFRKDSRLSKLPILDDVGRIHALVNRNDLAKNARYPDMLTDGNRQLRVFAAVTTHPQDDVRVLSLLEAGVDGFVVDSSQGATGWAVKRIRTILDLDPSKPVIAGNVVTPEQARPLIEAGAVALRVGMGSGSICITQEQLNLGRAQGSAVYHTAKRAMVIADGNIRTTGDMTTALSLGAGIVMAGRYVAGCDETPSSFIRHEGRLYKLYRGMGSVGAMRARGNLRYGGDQGYDDDVVVQGVEGLVPALGPVDKHLAKTLEALRQFLKKLGCASILDLHRDVAAGRIRFELRSEAARREGGVHDLEPLPRSG